MLCDKWLELPEWHERRRNDSGYQTTEVFKRPVVEKQFERLEGLEEKSRRAVGR